MEPFVVFNGLVEASIGGNVPLDAPSGLGCLGTIVVTGAVFAMGVVAANAATKDYSLEAALAVFGIGTAFTLLQFYLRPQRLIRRKVLGPVARALKPLEPTRDDLEACLQKCRSMRMKIGSALKVDHILSEMQGVPIYSKPTAADSRSGLYLAVTIVFVICLLFMLAFHSHHEASAQPPGAPVAAGWVALPPPATA